MDYLSALDKKRMSLKYKTDKTSGRINAANLHKKL
jgi:hypothetical protein